jgi:hypothetical protein
VSVDSLTNKLGKLCDKVSDKSTLMSILDEAEDSRREAAYALYGFFELD